MAKTAILCVDDDKISLKVMKEFLSDGDYEARFAHDAPSCMDSIRENKPDVILLDIELPGIKGYDICHTLKSNDLYSDIQIIFLTILDAEDVTNHCLGCREIYVLQKPFNHDALDNLLTDQLLQ